MPSPRPDLRLGRIVWASIRDHRGVEKERPLIVITATEDIQPDEPVEVMAVTTTFPEPPPEDHVPLPWHPQGRAHTRLRRRSAAVVTWIDRIDPDEVIRPYGDVPVRLMTQILESIGRPG